jgi:hypothetical protein
MTKEERWVIDAAMARYAGWCEENPEGLIYPPDDRAMVKEGIALVEACAALAAAKGK